MEIFWHLFGKVRAQGEGEFIVAKVPIPRQRIRDVIRFSHEPLTIALDVCVHENRCVFSCCVDSSCGLDWVVVGLNEIGFSHPPFCRRAVRHAECGIPGGEMTFDDIGPGGDDRGQEFE